jgi:hypothetical protein
MTSIIISFIYNNYLYIIVYLIIGSILCHNFCKTISKKQKDNIDKVNKKNLYLNRIDIIDNQIYYIIVLIVTGIIYLVKD